MAKIEIYETEKDVERETKRTNLENKITMGKTMAAAGLEVGAMFIAMGIFKPLFDKIGFTKAVRDTKLSQTMQAIPSRKMNDVIDRHWTAASLTTGGMLLLMGIIGVFKRNEARRELEELDKEEQQVIIPDNLSTNTLSQIPIRPVGEQKLHKVPTEQIKAHTERLLQDIDSETSKTR